MEKFKKALKIVLIIALVLIVCLLSATLIFVTTSIKAVKDMDISLGFENNTMCTFYDIDGKKIDSNATKNYVKINDISLDTINAFISIEDKNFYKHKGLNYKRIAKAAISNIAKGKVVEGASTITQQLVKNKFLNSDKTLSRKVKEAYLTKKIEQNYTKDEILENYLNTIYFGSGAYGIGNASLRYFSKEPKDLTLSESCILAGIIKSPSTYSPINNIDACKNRRNIVLNEMLTDGKITEKEYSNAIDEEIDLNPQSLKSIEKMDLYSKFALSEASKILGIGELEILNKGYKIYTNQNSELKSTLENIVNNEKYYQKNRYGNIPDSLSIIIDNSTGGVSAIAGKSKYDLVNFKRQPGSLIKPIVVYAPAIEEGLIYPSSEILDEKISINGYSPQNVSDKYYGYVSIKDAVAKSLNIPAVKICNELGIDKCKDYGEKAGLSFNESDVGLAVSLGGLTEGFTIQNIAESYLPFSNNGNAKKSSFIYKIINPLNLVVYKQKMSETNYCSKETAYMMTETLQYSTKNGTSKKLANCDFDVAGKTGTVNVKGSNLNTDAYSLAYTTKHTMCVWLGNYSMQNEYNLEGNNNGGTIATEIIKDTFNEIYSNSKPDIFVKPDTIKPYKIDAISLKDNHKVLLAESLPDKYTKLENFSIYNLPNESTLLSNISSPNLFLIDSSSNAPTLSFDCKDYYIYKIYKKYKERNQLLKVVQNFAGEYVFTDKSNTLDTANYFIEVSTNYSDKSIQSNVVTFNFKKDYDSILKSNNSKNLSWLFA